MQVARICMLDGSYKDYQLDRGSDGEPLFLMVCTDLSISERNYFSLCFYDVDGIRHWIYNDKKISKQLKGSPWEFAFEVKFYPTVPSSITDNNARHNLYMQLKKDILRERLPATMPTQSILGSLLAQAEFGDANDTAEYENYLQTAQIAPKMNDELMDQIKELHKGNKGQTPADAESKYLDNCKQLSKYGVFLFIAKDEHSQLIDLGICASGINIYQGSIRLHRFHWQSINKISFRRNTFSVKLNAGEMDTKEITLIFKVSDYTQAKRIWKCGVEHHTFFRLAQSDEKQKLNLFRWGSMKFRFHGRSHSKTASQIFDTSAASTLQRQSPRVLQPSKDVQDSMLEQSQPLSAIDQSYEVLSSEEKPVDCGEEGHRTTTPVEVISTKTVIIGNRTVETITYAREVNGVIETHYEHRVVINSTTDIDHDAELSAAILGATKMSPDMLVVDIRQEVSI